jgi:hypothetical protein
MCVDRSILTSVRRPVTAQLPTYNGTTYRLRDESVGDLLARGVIVPDEDDADRFRLDLEHVIEEIEPFATISEHLSGDDARGEGQDTAKRRLFAVRFGHRDGQGGAR